jgi:hypothetical protein
VSARSGVDGPALIQRSAGTRRRWEHGAVMNSRLRPGTPTALLALCLSAWLVASPHAVFNLADRNQDFDQHLAWAFQVGQGLAAGDPYPRWMPLGNRGLGEPALLYYSPAYSLAVSLLRPLTDATWSAMRLVEFLALLGLGLAGWALLRRFARPLPALLGAMACQATPMVFMLFNHFNGFPWASNAAGFGLLLWAALRLPAMARRHGDAWAGPRAPSATDGLLRVPVACAVALMTLTHLVSTLMALICLTPALVWLWSGGVQAGRRALLRAALSWGLSAGLGLALAGVFLLPALASMDLISAREWTETYRPHDAFSFPTITAWRYGIRWFGFQWPVSLVCLGLTGAGVWLLRRQRARRPEAHGPEGMRTEGARGQQAGRTHGQGMVVAHAPARRAAIALLIASACALLLASELSLPLWLIDTPLRKVQFPHRFLFVSSISASWALALLAGSGPADDRLGRRVAVAALLGAALLTALLATRLVLRDGEPVNAGDDTIRAYGSYSEYTLPWQRPAALDWQRAGGLEAELAQTGVRLIAPAGNGAGGWRWVLATGEPQRIRLPVLWFPAWRLTLDGAPHPASADPQTGLVALTLPAGEHALRLRWQRLPAEQAGAALSLLALAVCALVLWRDARQRRQGARRASRAAAPAAATASR